DDSIVRGTNTPKLIQMCRDVGATEVHVRIPSSPYAWPCFFGMDTRNTDDLVAFNNTINGIKEEIGADSLEFLEIEDILDVVNDQSDPNNRVNKIGQYCTACMTGDYKSEIPVTFTS